VVLLGTPLKGIFSYDVTSPDAPSWVLPVTAFHFFMFLYSSFVLVFCILHLLGDRRVSRGAKMLWGILLILGNVFVFPLYWFFRIRSAGEE